jgi:hypothetical protein
MIAVLPAGRNIRVLSVVDAFTRECLALEVDTGFPAGRVTQVLDEIITRRKCPQAIRCDKHVIRKIQCPLLLAPVSAGRDNPTRSGSKEAGCDLGFQGPC